MIIKYLLLIIWILCSCNIHKEEHTTTLPDLTTNEETQDQELEQTETTTGSL